MLFRGRATPQVPECFPPVGDLAFDAACVATPNHKTCLGHSEVDSAILWIVAPNASRRHRHGRLVRIEGVGEGGCREVCELPGGPSFNSDCALIVCEVVHGNQLHRSEALDEAHLKTEPRAGTRSTMHQSTIFALCMPQVCNLSIQEMKLLVNERRRINLGNSRSLPAGTSHARRG